MEQGRQVAEISSEFNQRIDAAMPDWVKESCRRITASYVTGGKDAKELGAVLDVILPEDVRERIDGLRKERHMRIKAVICKKSRMVPEVRVRVPPAKRLPINSKRYSTASVLFAINGG